MSRASRAMLWILKAVAPLVTVAVSVGLAYWLVQTKPQPPQQDAPQAAPAVRIARAHQRTVCFPIHSQGTVAPRTESTLVAPVMGRIVEVAESFDESGFFRKGDVLVQIDRRDFQVRIERLEAALRASQAEQREARSTLQRQTALRERQATSQAELDRAQAAFDMAAARISELQAQLAEAKNSDTDAAVVAPFDGCIRDKKADQGQYVTPGTPLATCFATDSVEVRLPVEDQDFGMLGLPLAATLEPDRRPSVVLEAQFAGKRRRWQGTIVRSEAMIDPRSRMVYLVASVDHPYQQAESEGSYPLAVGMFVDAQIRCRPVPDAFVLPEACVSHDGKLFVVDSEKRLQARKISVVRRQQEWVVVRGELSDSEQVCATRLEHPIPGMQVQVVDDVTPAYATAGRGEVLDLCAALTASAERPGPPARKE